MVWHLLFRWSGGNGNMAVCALPRGGRVCLWVMCFEFALGSQWVKSTGLGEFIVPGKLDHVGVQNDAKKRSWGFPVIVLCSFR